MAEHVTFGHARVRVAQHVLDQPSIAGHAVERRPVTVAEAVGPHAAQSELINCPVERPPDGRHREGAECPEGFPIGQRLGRRRTQRDGPRTAALPCQHHERLRRPVPVFRAVAHQLAGPQAGKRQHATPHFRGGRGPAGPGRSPVPRSAPPPPAGTPGRARACGRDRPSCLDYHGRWRSWPSRH